MWCEEESVPLEGIPRSPGYVSAAKADHEITFKNRFINIISFVNLAGRRYFTALSHTTGLLSSVDVWLWPTQTFQMNLFNIPTSTAWSFTQPHTLTPIEFLTFLSSTLKLEVWCSSETLVYNRKATWYTNPTHNSNQHRGDKLKSYDKLKDFQRRVLCEVE
jgi:hypothetical protein